MISLEIDDERIDGLSRLLMAFPREFSFEGAYLMGFLVHDNGDVQLTYTLSNQKTFIIAFRMSDCRGCQQLLLFTTKCAISGIDVSEGADGRLLFSEKTNGVSLSCSAIEILTTEILEKQRGEEQKVVLSRNYINAMIKKFDGIEGLRLPDGRPLFRRDDNCNGIVSFELIMYKLPSLRSADGSLEYEFLVEFDKSDPCVGIYYGCKGLILSGDSQAQQDRLTAEWEMNIKPRVCQKLNAIFPGKSFDNRFKPTDNANNNSFWPFWLSLYEDENLIEVAVRATVIIRTEYKRFLEGELFCLDDTCRYVVGSLGCGLGAPRLKRGETHSESRLTEESFVQLMNPWKEKNAVEFNGRWRQLLTKFLERAERAGLLRSNVENYEKAYMFLGDNTTFLVMMQLLVNRINSEDLQVPWGVICKQFLDRNGNIFKGSSLKSSNTRYWKAEKEKFWRRHKSELKTWYFRDRMAYEAESSNKIVEEFRNLMM